MSFQNEAKSLKLIVWNTTSVMYSYVVPIPSQDTCLMIRRFQVQSHYVGNNEDYGHVKDQGATMPGLPRNSNQLRFN